MTRLAHLLPCALLCSCGFIGQLRKPKPDGSNLQVVMQRSNDPFAPVTGSLQFPGASTPPASGAADAVPGAPATAAAAGPAPMFDFSSAFSSGGVPSRAAGWQRSGSEAVTEARRSGRPLLILASHHQTPTAARLEQMLNTAPEARRIGDDFVALYVDYADRDTRESRYYRALQDRYRVRGYPVLIAALPDGTEVLRQSGYAGDPRAEAEWRRRTLQFIAAAAGQAAKAAAARRKRLETQGYRLWTAADGRPVFAKLESLDANQATFTGEWGETFRTFTSRLSEADRRFLPRPP